MAYILYNTQWRGLAELLILTERQCEGQMSGISKEVSPTSFLCPMWTGSITEVLTFNAETGRVVGKENFYENN